MSEQKAQQIQLEQQLLGSLLEDGARSRFIPVEFNASYFTEPVHRRLYEFIGRRLASNQVVSPKDIGRLAIVRAILEPHGIAYLSELQRTAPGIDEKGLRALWWTLIELKNERASHAAEKGQKPQGDVGEHQDRNVGRKATTPGGRNRGTHGGQPETKGEVLAVGTAD